MYEKDRRNANRVLLGAGIGFISIIVLLLLGSLLASYSPDNSYFLPLKLVIGLVGVAIVIGDRVYVSKRRK
jgi:cadmium resistance protein CadD (predicted permease)